MRVSFLCFITVIFINCKLTRINNVPIDKEKVLRLDADAYIKILRDKEKVLLLKNPYLKINKVYVEKKNNIYTFSIFSENGDFCASTFRMTDKFKETDSISVRVGFEGVYRLYTNKQIRISCSENSAYRGYYHILDKGYIDGDTVRMRKTAVASENNLFKKRLLSFYIPKRRNFVYQPNFKVKNIQTDKRRGDVFLIKGVLKKEDSLTLIRENLKDINLENKKK